MTEQKCVRTYATKYTGCNDSCSEANCAELNSYLKVGWKVVMVTPKAEYNEYIIEREIDNSRNVKLNCVRDIKE